MKKILLVFFLIIISLYLTNCATTTGKISSENSVSTTKQISGEDLYSEAVAALGVDNYNEAKFYFLKALKKNYKPIGCYYYLGLIEYQQGDLDKAEKFLKKCLSLDNNITDAHNTLGAIYAKKKQYKNAIEEFKKVLLDKTYLYPENALYNLALLYYKLENYRESIKYCKQALKYVPKSPAVLYLIALNLHKQGFTRASLKIIKTIIRDFPDNIWGSKAKIFLKKYGDINGVKR